MRVATVRQGTLDMNIQKLDRVDHKARKIFAPEVSAGSFNLLINCAGLARGQRLLIAYEPERHQYFYDDALALLRADADALGIVTEVLDVGFNPEAAEFHPDLCKTMAGFDVVIFLARLGDQLRFSTIPDGPKIVNSYTLSADMIRSPYSASHYDGFTRLKRVVDDVIGGAQDIKITCPNGTLVTGRAPDQGYVPSDTSVTRFPVSVFSPVPAQSFSGKIALSGFLTGTGSRYYTDNIVEFEGQVFAFLEEGELLGFEGSVKDVARANAQYDRVSGQFGIDRNFVHSWHAGIHPGCGFPWDMRKHYDQWSGAAFGNPRVLHFHTCGAYAPGEICWNLIDASIEIDGLKIWDQGVFRADLLPGGTEILSQYPCVRNVFDHPDRDIGFWETSSTPEVLTGG